MKYRLVKAEYTTTPDSYEHGEDPSKEQWDDLHYVTGDVFNSIDELLSKVASLFGEDYSPDYWVLLPDDSGGKPSLQTDILVDESITKASNDEIDRWKQGKTTLYNVHIFLVVEVFEDSHFFSEDDAAMAGIEVY